MALHQLSQLKHNNAMATAISYLLQGNQNIPIVQDTSLSLLSKKRNIFIVTTQFTIKLKDCHILYTEHTGSLHACVATNKTIKVFKNKKSKFSGENSTQN